MRMPPARPTVPRPAGASVSLPKPVIVVDTREQAGYTFARFRSWFSSVEHRALATGDYSIAGLQDRIAVERKSLPDLFHSCAPSGGREIFVRACERLGALEFAALVIEGSLEQPLDGHPWTELHPTRAQARRGFVLLDTITVTYSSMGIPTPPLPLIPSFSLPGTLWMGEKARLKRRLEAARGASVIGYAKRTA